MSQTGDIPEIFENCQKCAILAKKTWILVAKHQISMGKYVFRWLFDVDLHFVNISLIVQFQKFINWHTPGRGLYPEILLKIPSP